jgi:hypothetical protein
MNSAGVFVSELADSEEERVLRDGRAVGSICEGFTAVTDLIDRGLMGVWLEMVYRVRG